MKRALPVITLLGVLAVLGVVLFGLSYGGASSESSSSTPVVSEFGTTESPAISTGANASQTAATRTIYLPVCGPRTLPDAPHLI